jgi:hypothetical protein
MRAIGRPSAFEQTTALRSCPNGPAIGFSFPNDFYCLTAPNFKDTPVFVVNRNDQSNGLVLTCPAEPTSAITVMVLITQLHHVRLALRRQLAGRFEIDWEGSGVCR